MTDSWRVENPSGKICHEGARMRMIYNRSEQHIKKRNMERARGRTIIKSPSKESSGR